MKTLRLILGDQLNIQHSWYESVSESNVYCMFEMRQETDYVKHHIQKVVGFFAAMREFSKQLEAQGHKVVYLTLDDTANLQNLEDNLNDIITTLGIETFEYQSPDEYRLDAQLKSFCNTLSIPIAEFDTEHFYTKRDELSVFYEGKKQFLMERFYRYMRKKHHILMDGVQPEGGEWNYDKSNRNKWKGSPEIPPFLDFKNPVSDILKTINNCGIDTIGRFDLTTFSYPINRKQSLDQLDYFNQNLLVHFGDYQDALHNEEVYLFHSRLSFAMNLKLISPKEIVDAVLVHYRANYEEISISQVEGFIRQVIGWREYMRGMYWAQMPEYKTLNTLDNHHAIPGSKQVETQIIEEGLKDIFNDAGFELRQPGCSACLAMNDDKIPQNEYCVSTSNRNFEGRQGPGSRTILASPLVAAVTAIEGKIIDITKQLN